MKIKHFFLVFLSTLILSCNKENLVEDGIISGKTSNANPKSSTTILNFNSLEELNETMNKLHFFEEEQRRSFENSKNFKSLMTHVLEVYEELKVEYADSNDENFSNVASEFQSLNSHLFTIRQDAEDEKSREFYIHYIDNKYSVVANKDRIFTVKDFVFKVFDDGVLGTHKDNMDELLNVKEVNYENLKLSENVFVFSSEIDKTEKTTCAPRTNERFSPVSNRNRTKLIFKVRNPLISANVQAGQFVFSLDTEGIIRPQKRTAGIWFAARRTISGRIKYSVTYVNGTTHPINVNETIVNHLAYSARRFKNVTQPTNTNVSEEKFTSIDSWGDTPSTSPVTLICSN